MTSPQPEQPNVATPPPPYPVLDQLISEWQKMFDGRAEAAAKLAAMDADLERYAQAVRDFALSVISVTSTEATPDAPQQPPRTGGIFRRGHAPDAPSPDAPHPGWIQPRPVDPAAQATPETPWQRSNTPPPATNTNDAGVALGQRITNATKGNRGIAGRAPRWPWWRSPILWTVRSLLLIPLILMTPGIAAETTRGSAADFAQLSHSTADVLGTSVFLCFIAMMTVTPLATTLGWRWHIVLRRDLGIGMFFLAISDLAIAAITTSDTFPGGFLSRTVGHAFLFFGVLSTVLLVPLVLTANRASMQWLGKYWKWVQRGTYLLWVTILLHLLILFGFRSFFTSALEVSVVLFVLRLPPVRRWWIAARKNKTYFYLRFLLGAILLSVFIFGLQAFVVELVHKGANAWALHSSD